MIIAQRCATVAFVYNDASRNPSKDNATHDDLLLISEKESEIAVLQSKSEAAEQMSRERDGTIRDLRERLDNESEERRKLTMMITDQREKKEEAETALKREQSKGFLARLLGN